MRLIDEDRELGAGTRDGLLGGELVRCGGAFVGRDPDEHSPQFGDHDVMVGRVLPHESLHLGGEGALAGHAEEPQPQAVGRAPGVQLGQGRRIVRRDRPQPHHATVGGQGVGARLRPHGDPHCVLLNRTVRGMVATRNPSRTLIALRHVEPPAPQRHVRVPKVPPPPAQSPYRPAVFRAGIAVAGSTSQSATHLPGRERS